MHYSTHGIWRGPSVRMISLLLSWSSRSGPGMSPMAGFIGKSGFFGSGPSGEVGEDAPLQSRLLDLSGRRP